MDGGKEKRSNGRDGGLGTLAKIRKEISTDGLIIWGSQCRKHCLLFANASTRGSKAGGKGKEKEKRDYRNTIRQPPGQANRLRERKKLGKRHAEGVAQKCQETRKLITLKGKIAGWGNL